MSVTSGFFNSVNGDRKYDAQQMSSIFDGIINDGVFASIGTAFSVQATTGNTVTVGTGRAWFDHAWLLNDSTLPIELDDAEVLLDRIDAIVIEINHSESIRAGSIKVINGTPSSAPANPTMTHTDYINQYPIAYIMRSANSSAITQANITYTVGSDACPFITGLLSVVSIQSIVAQWESEFDTWLDSLSAMLDDNTAANLANQILELKEQFDTLAREKKIYSELEDSTGEDTIDDSTGNPILGTTSMYSDEGSSESIPVSTGGDPYKVGDILTTARTDLGAKWLLCNGDELDRDLYPELANLFPNLSNITGPWNETTFWTGKTFSSSTIDIQSVLHANGFYIVAGSNPNYGSIAYASSLDGPWTEKNVFGEASESASRASVIGTMLFENGTYYILGAEHSDVNSSSHPDSNKSQYATVVAYAQNLAGSWTTIYPTGFNSSEDEGFSRFNAFANDGSRYITAFHAYYSNSGTEYHRLKVAYTSNLKSSSWTTSLVDTVVVNEVDSTYVNYLGSSCMVYLNGYYIIGAQYYGDADNPGTSINSKSLLYYSQNISGSYTKVTLQTINEGYVGDILGIFYINNQYVVFANGDNQIKVFTSGSLSGPWSSQVVNIPSDKEPSPLLRDVLYKDGQYIICTVRNVYQSESLNGPWTPWSNDGTTLGARLQTVIVDANGIIITGGNLADAGGDGTYGAAIWNSSTGEITLPSISLSDKTYTYIRAKE